MHRPRHRPRRSAGISFSLLAVIAALCLACLPALAQADSSEKQYEVDVPGIPQAPKQKAKADETKEPSAKASTPDEPKTGPSEANGGGDKSSEDESDKQGGAAGGGNGGDNNGGGNAEKSPSGGGGSNQAQTGVGDEQSLGGTTQGQNASHSSGGSSPLVPILIAVAVLAAISIGAVVYRQRRQGSGGSGSPVSPSA